MNKVTPIEMLPNLEDLESSPPENSPKYNKFIRGNHVTPEEAGMHPYQTPITEYMFNVQEQQQNQQLPQIIPQKQEENTPNCLNVAEHTSNCPVCSKLYNTDKTLYIVTIIILCIIIILLLKKILEL